MTHSDPFTFLVGTVLGIFGLYLGVKTEIASRDNVGRYYLSIYAKWGGWILGVLSLIGAARVLLMMLGLG